MAYRLQRIREERSRGGSGKLLLLTIVGLLFWLGVYRLLYKILTYFRGVEDLGPLLAGKLLGVALLSFITILVLSNVVTALSSFFLAKDLDLLVSAPVDWLRIYLAKLGETLLHSSWMVALMAVPIFTAYGVIYRGGLLFIPTPCSPSFRCWCSGRGRLGPHARPGEHLPGAPHARPALDRRVRRGGRPDPLVPAGPAGAAGIARGVPQPARLHRGAPRSDVAVPAERMGDAGHHELPARSARPAALALLWTTAAALSRSARCSTAACSRRASRKRRRG